MTTVKILDRPNFVVGKTTYADDEIWVYLSSVNNWTTKNPLDASLGRKVQDGWLGYNQSFGQEKWKMVDAYYQPLQGPISLVAGAELPAGACLVVAIKGQYTGYGNSEDYFAPLFLRGGKWLYLQVSDDGMLPGGFISRGFSVASDFLPGALLVVAIAVSANAAGAYFTGAEAGASTLVGPTDWELATGGMGTGMGTGGVIGAPVVPAAASPGIFETLTGIGGTAVQTAESVAKAVVATRDAVDAVKTALNPPDSKKDVPAPDDNQTLIYAGAALAVLALIG